MEKVCVLHINTTFTYKAASCLSTFAVVRALADHGYQPVQIAGKPFQPSPLWDLSGITIERVPSLIKYIDPVRDLSALRAVYALLRKYRPTLVHTHLAKAGVIGRIAARLARVPIIVHTVHGPTFAPMVRGPQRLLFKSLERFCGRFTDYFIFVGEELRSEYVQNGICALDSTLIVRRGRPKSEIEALDRLTFGDLATIRRELVGSEASFVIGCVGRLVPSKAQERAIDVLKLVRGKGIDAHLVLIGEGLLGEEKWYEGFLRRHAAALGLSDVVHFIGYRPDALVCMKAMDVVVMTSKYEGLPNVAVEAGICGRPMVAFSVCGIGEVVKDGATGFIVKFGDIETMAERLVSLARDPALASRLGAEASKQLQGTYNLESMVTEKLRFYDSVIAGLSVHC